HTRHDWGVHGIAEGNDRRPLLGRGERLPRETAAARDRRPDVLAVDSDVGPRRGTEGDRRGDPEDFSFGQAIPRGSGPLRSPSRETAGDRTQSVRTWRDFAGNP